MLSIACCRLNYSMHECSLARCMFISQNIFMYCDIVQPDFVKAAFKLLIENVNRRILVLLFTAVRTIDVNVMCDGDQSDAVHRPSVTEYPTSYNQTVAEKITEMYTWLVFPAMTYR